MTDKSGLAERLLEMADWYESQWQDSRNGKFDIADLREAAQAMRAEGEPVRNPDTGELRDDLEAISERVYQRFHSDFYKQFGINLPGCDTTDKAVAIIEQWCIEAIHPPAVTEAVEAAALITHDYFHATPDEWKAKYGNGNGIDLEAAIRATLKNAAADTTQHTGKPETAPPTSAAAPSGQTVAVPREPTA